MFSHILGENMSVWSTLSIQMESGELDIVAAVIGEVCMDIFSTVKSGHC